MIFSFAVAAAGFAADLADPAGFDSVADPDFADPYLAAGPGFAGPDSDPDLDLDDLADFVVVAAVAVVAVDVYKRQERQ